MAADGGFAAWAEASLKCVFGAVEAQGRRSVGLIGTLGWRDSLPLRPLRCSWSLPCSRKMVTERSCLSTIRRYRIRQATEAEHKVCRLRPGNV
jgi:hypothetical protein